MSRYPQHDKVREVKAASQAIGEFLEAMAVRGFQLCERLEQPPSAHEYPFDSGEYPDEYAPTDKPIEQLLAIHFGIDLKLFAAEKEAMLHEAYGEVRDG